MTPGRHESRQSLELPQAPQTPWLLWYGVTLHVFWAIAVLYEPRVRLITPLAGFAAWPTWSISVFCVTVACMAGSPFLCQELRRYWLYCAMPQQIVLLISSFTSIMAVVRGQYGDGAVYPRLFIATDQAATILIAVFHTWLLMDMAGVFGRRGNVWHSQSP